MKHRAPWIAVLVLAGCGAPQGSADVMAELRQIRAEQQRQSQRVELLESRVVLAEDAARQARQALVTGGGRATVRIDPEGGETRVIPAVPEVPSSGDESEGDGPASEDSGPRPLVRVNGREPGGGSGGMQPPIVVRDGDRIPVAPLPPPPSSPGRRPRGPTPSERESAPGYEPAAAPPDEGATVSPAPSSPTAGVSSVRDPRAAPAYQSALEMARAGRCGEAVDAMTAFLVRWPDHPFAENAMYWRGECILANGEVRRAAGEFEGLLARFPTGNKAADALYKLVVCYRRLADAARAEQYGARLAREFPRSDAAARLQAERNR